MLKKILLVCLITIIGACIVIAVWYFSSIPNEQISDTSSQADKKLITLASSINDVITFSVPADWNAAYNGDPELLRDLENFGRSTSIVMSVSVADRPVTYTDINWEQVDLYLTGSDLIGSDTMNNVESASDQVVQDISLKFFSGFVITDILDSGTPNKVNAGGSIYFLRPKSNDVEWNLIMVKQSKGSDEFEAGVSIILQTLEFQNYSEYVEELNK